MIIYFLISLFLIPYFSLLCLFLRKFPIQFNTAYEKTLLVAFCDPFAWYHGTGTETGK